MTNCLNLTKIIVFDNSEIFTPDWLAEQRLKDGRCNPSLEIQDSVQICIIEDYIKEFCKKNNSRVFYSIVQPNSYVKYIFIDKDDVFDFAFSYFSTAKISPETFMSMFDVFSIREKNVIKEVNVSEEENDEDDDLLKEISEKAKIL